MSQQDQPTDMLSEHTVHCSLQDPSSPLWIISTPNVMETPDIVQLYLEADLLCLDFLPYLSLSESRVSGWGGKKRVNQTHFTVQLWCELQSLVVRLTHMSVSFVTVYLLCSTFSCGECVTIACPAKQLQWVGGSRAAPGQIVFQMYTR